MAGTTGVKKRRLPGLEPPKVKEDELRRYLESVREHLNMYEGAKGFPTQRFPTLDELEAAGIIRTITKAGYATISEVNVGGQFVVAGSIAADGTSGSTADSTPGTSGADGRSVFVAHVYRRSATAPATPTKDDGSYDFATQELTPPTGWNVSPPAADGNSLYVSTGTFEIDSSFGIDSTVVWSAPVVFANDGLSVYVANVYKRSTTAPATPTADDGQYDFTNNVLTPPTGWSSTPPVGTDPLYVSTGSFEIYGGTGTDTTVTWTSPDVLVQDGAAGADGADGGDGLSVHVANVYKRSATAPSTPTADDGSYNFTTNTLTPPSGWSVEPPAGTDPLYVSTGSFSVIGSIGTDNTVTWTAPDLLVQDGADAITSHLTNEAHVVQAANDGTSYSLTEAGGTHKVFDKTTDVTTSATHSVNGTATKNGLTMTVVSSTGVYSLSGASWTSDLETFTLRAVYDGKTLDKEYTIAKAKAGAGIGTITVSGESISDTDSSTARVGVRVNNDGTIDKWEGGIYTQIDSGTDWIVPNAHPGLTYHVRLTVSSGDGPGTGTTNTWLAVTDSPEWKISNTDNDIKSGNWLIEISGDAGETTEDSGTYVMYADNT